MSAVLIGVPPNPFEEIGRVVSASDSYLRTRSTNPPCALANADAAATSPR